MTKKYVLIFKKYSTDYSLAMELINYFKRFIFNQKEYVVGMNGDFDIKEIELPKRPKKRNRNL